MIKDFLKPLIENSPGLARLYRSGRDLLDRNQPSIRTPWGFKISGHPDMATGVFEPAETLIVRTLLNEVDVFVNVGANVGYYCCHALSMGKPVIAVEPIARNLHYLLRNIRDNGWATKAEVFPVALARGTDIMEIWGGGTGASLVKGWASIPESYVTQVPVLSLDRLLNGFLRGKRALILVDIEGAEYMMLQGSAQTLINNPRPVWIVEIATTEHQPVGRTVNPFISQTFELFFDLGYRSFTAKEYAEEITLNTVADVVDGRSRFTTHNFVFR